MTPEQQDSLTRIEKAALTGAENDLLFTKKLAQQNGWTVGQAIAAIAEYRRFLFLAMHAGHPVSPSDSVDQVWHLHLLYTHYYWKEFCPNVLGKPFHHHPSKGGQVERTKFKNWYEDTLESYREFFEQEPPADFWPPTDEKTAQDSRIHRRVDLGGHWVIPKPRFLRDVSLNSTARLAGALLLLLLTVGCSTLGQLLPWNMQGPDFLVLFFGIMITCWLAAFRLRQSRRIPAASSDESMPELDLYQTAYLGGGACRLAQAVLGKLIGAGVLQVHEKTGEISRLRESYEGEPVEEIAFRAANGVNMQKFREEVAPYYETTANQLTELGLLVEKSAQRGMVLQPSLIALAPVLIGGLKLYFGIMRDKPFEVLLFFEIVSIVVALGFFCQRPFRQQKGRRSFRATAANESKFSIRPPGKRKPANSGDARLGNRVIRRGYCYWNTLRLPEKSTRT